MNETKRLSISMTREERIWGWLYVPFFLVLLSWILAEGFRLLGWETETLLGQARLNGAFFGVNFLATVLIYRKFLSKSLVMVGKRFWGFLQAVILGLAMYYAGALLIGWVVRLWQPSLENVNDAAIAAMARESRWVMVVGTVLLTPMVEECIFRGLLFQGLHRHNRAAAYALSTVTFCLGHVIGYVGQVELSTLAILTLEYLPAGIALGWAYEKADTIFAPILMHGLVNALSMRVLW